MTISIGTFDDLQPDRPQPIDRNPSLPCERCGNSYNWQDYWKDRFSKPDGVFWCDSCWGEFIEEAWYDRHERDHKTFGEWS